MKENIGNANEIKDIIGKAKAGDVIDIIAGDLEIDVESTEVTIGNSGGGAVKINGTEVNKGEAVVVHNIVHVPAKAPTATEDGNIEYWYCEDCSTYYKDEELSQEIKKEDTVLKATGEIRNEDDTEGTDEEDIMEETNKTSKSDKTKVTSSPKTGDTAQTGLYLILAIAALCAGGVAVKKKVTK